MSAGDIASAVLLLLSAAFALQAALGLWRFDDVFSRIHAATKAITLGVLLVAVGAALRVELWGDVMRLLLAAALQLSSAPVAGHMLGRAAYWAGPEVRRRIALDQLADTQAGAKLRGEVGR